MGFVICSFTTVTGKYGKTLIYWTHVDSSPIGERIKANLIQKETSVSFLYFHT